MRLVCKNQRGITLLELLMVIIVIGLVICGVMLKRAIEHQARISYEIQRLGEYETAFNGFRIKYNGMPGDLKNAKDFWSSTENGNGDNTIRTLENGFSDKYNYGGEMSHVFEQLSLSYMLNQKFDSSIELGKGVPTSTLNEKMGMSLYNGNVDNVSINVFYGNANALPNLEKADEPSIATGNVSGFLQPYEVISLKVKLGSDVFASYCGSIKGKPWCRYWYIIK